MSEWSKKRARGERVTLEPPSLGSDGTAVATTTRMGRIDSPAGRKMAALDAEKAAKEKAKREKEAAAAQAKAEAAAQVAVPEPSPTKAAAVESAEPVDAADGGSEDAGAKPGLLGRMTKSITNIF